MAEASPPVEVDHEEDSTSLNHKPKSLVIFCDGTAQDGLLSRTDHTTGKDAVTSTNILRLSRAVRRSSKLTGREQIVYYQPGVGTDADFYGRPGGSRLSVVAYGTTVASKIRDVYGFIAANYCAEDDICLFGFSRGAYTVRKVSGLIETMGILSQQQMGKFYLYWQYLIDSSKGERPPTPPEPIPIKVVGCFDTVGSVWHGPGNPVLDALSIDDNKLVPNVKVALHALAFHENRPEFKCTTWDESNKSPDQIVKQVWFGGAHSEVGGGYGSPELADISLFWMVDELRTGKLVDIDESMIEGFRSPVPENPETRLWGGTMPRNSWAEYGWFRQLILWFLVGSADRLQEKEITSESIFHRSLLNSPSKLLKPKNMITLDKLRDVFSKELPRWGEWNPKLADLGDFELKMQRQWNQKLDVRSSMPVEHLSQIRMLLEGVPDAPRRRGFTSNAALTLLKYTA
ncbi:hypothetical protein SISSUDRAFT_1131136 [Sistotremastrum suecicum HHB10207 ss-3]|uniref:T6SS Phospholipase effector Tle1-like catalytic domain-containing protein n=1 Tax=Sistotremastrum suecicum HHB10207 ss-3 TaxID=1314776 RepID=A0A166AKI2_9AGAM|nr:hypothetical protein SISSUDRAFT_1131136 [Sistotremastrum suecicum HHB10207 ss-3]